MTQNEEFLVEGEVVDDLKEISIRQLCRSCAAESELVERLVAEGVLEPCRREGTTLYFPHSSMKRTRIVVRLRSDLGVNIAGAALAIELLERIDRLNLKLKKAGMPPLV